MEFQNLVESRRSIRSYQENVTITNEEFETMIECALEAPSWKNTETARYYVVNTPEKIEEVCTSCLPEFNQKNCKNASIVVTTFEMNRSGFERDGSPTNEIGQEWGAYDLGLSNAYFVLKAKEMGYDTLIMGIRDAAKLREKLNIPDSQEVVSVIAVGKRTEDAQRPVRKTLDRVATFI